MLSITKFAKRLGICRTTAEALIRDGAIEVYDIGSTAKPSWRITEESLAKFIEERRKPKPVLKTETVDKPALSRMV